MNDFTSPKNKVIADAARQIMQKSMADDRVRQELLNQYGVFSEKGLPYDQRDKFKADLDKKLTESSKN